MEGCFPENASVKDNHSVDVQSVAAPPSATEVNTQQNCNANNSLLEDGGASLETVPQNIKDVLNTDANGNDEMPPERPEENEKGHSSSSQTKSGGSNEWRDHEPSTSSNAPGSQLNANKLIRGRKKINKEGNLCVYPHNKNHVLQCWHVRLKVYVAMFVCSCRHFYGYYGVRKLIAVGQRTVFI